MASIAQAKEGERDIAMVNAISINNNLIENNNLKVGGKEIKK